MTIHTGIDIDADIDFRLIIFETYEWEGREDVKTKFNDILQEELEKCCDGAAPSPKSSSFIHDMTEIICEMVNNSLRHGVDPNATFSVDNDSIYSRIVNNGRLSGAQENEIEERDKDQVAPGNHVAIDISTGLSKITELTMKYPEIPLSEGHEGTASNYQAYLIIPKRELHEFFRQANR